MADLDVLTKGMVEDMMVESANDQCEYDKKASQEDFDNF